MKSPGAVKRVLVIGQGSIGKRHSRLLTKQFPELSVTSIGHRQVYGDDFAKSGQFNTPVDPGKLLEANPDAAIVAGPASAHLAIARCLLNAGVHVLIEKPVACTSEGVKELQLLAERRRCVVLLGYNLRFSNSLNRFKQCLTDQIVGRILSVRCEVGQYLPDWRCGADFKQSVSAQKLLGGGVLLELSHEIDYLQWIFGSICLVSGQLLQQSEWGLDVEDTAHILLTFTPRNNSSALVASLNMDFIRRDSTRMCVAIGEEGSLLWDAIEGRVSVRYAGSSKWEPIFTENVDGEETYLKEHHHFFECIQNQHAPLVGIAQGLRVMEVIDAVRQSSNQQQSVEVL